MTKVRKINHKSDFDFILVVKDSQGNDVGFPDYDFSGSVSVGEPCKATSRKFPFSRKGNTLVNCFNDNGKIHIVCNDHHLSKGQLWVELKAEVPNGIYSDGSELIVIPQQIGIELVCEKGDIPTDVDSEFVVPFIYTSAYEMAKRAGYDGTEEEYADFANRLPSVVKSAEQAVTDAAQALKKAEEAAQESEAIIEKANLAADAALQNAGIAKQSANSAGAAATAATTAAGNASQAANAANETKQELLATNERIETKENSRVVAEAERVTDENKRLEAEVKRIADENKRVVAEAERVSNEENRIKEFASFKDDYVQKPKSGSDGQVLTKHGDTVVWSDEIKKQLFIDLWNNACKSADKPGKYNEETDFFEWNGLTDITYEEAIDIYTYYTPFVKSYGYAYYSSKIRANIPIPFTTVRGEVSSMFCECKNLEIATLYGVTLDHTPNTFKNCRKLRRVNVSYNCRGGGYFPDSPLLEYVDFYWDKWGNSEIDLTPNPLLTYVTFKNAITNSSKSIEDNPESKRVIKVHSNIYNALIGNAEYPFNEGTQEQWQQLLTDATEKQITFATE